MADLTAIFVALPKPTGLTFNYQKDWGPEETNAYGALASGNLIGAAKTAGMEALAKMASANAASALESKYKKTINKRNKVLFRDLPFRQVTFNWILRPRSAVKAAEFMDIIETLKYESAPSLIQDGSLWDTSGMTWSLTINTTNRVIFHSNELVITDLTVNYTPNGFWSQHKDGYPTEIHLDLALMELELAHKGNLANKSGTGPADPRKLV